MSDQLTIDTTHCDMMRSIESMGFSVVPGFVSAFCFKGREAAIDQSKEKAQIVTFWLDGRRTLMVPCIDGCFELPFETKQECFTAYEVLDEFGYLAYGGKRRSEY